ncbi:MAG TPA: hypothetical protein VFX20_19935 [Steroidobacteraceae bacterium]|nr:hypothetical protein [Steroidobacteraceae bacterium]
MKGIFVAPTFDFDRAMLGLDSSLVGPYPKREWALRWLNLLGESGRWFRTVRGQIVYLADRGPPDSFVHVSNRLEFQTLVQDGESVIVRSPRHDMSPDDWTDFWRVTSNFRRHLPSAAGRFTEPRP